MNVKEAIERVKKQMGEKANEPDNRFVERFPPGYRMNITEENCRAVQEYLRKRNERTTDND